jgi:hypothetical protein
VRFWRRGTILAIPIVHCVLVPVINLLFQRHDARLLRAQPFAVTSTVAADPNAKFDVVRDTLHQAEAALAAPLEHPFMVPATQANGTKTADHIGDQVE